MEYSVFVGNTVVLDKAIWHLWLMGLNVDKAASYTTQRANLPDMSPAIVRNFVISQYRNYELLETYLHRPKHLLGQLIFQLTPETKHFLIESYYSFDPNVMRGILGKKMTARSRKELEEVSLKSRVPLGGCRRMFDNLKRITKKVEDSDGNIYSIIQTDFLLPEHLARQYGNIIFINNFRLDTSKKRLSHLRFSDFEYCASVFLQYFTLPSASALEDLDPALVSDSTYIKNLLFNNKEVMEEYRQLVKTRLEAMGLGNILELGKNPSNSSAAFKSIIKNILTIGQNLSQGRNLRDLFTNLVEKVVDPCTFTMCWDSEYVGLVFGIVLDCFPLLETVNPTFRKKYLESFTRLVTAMKLCTARLVTIALLSRSNTDGGTGSITGQQTHTMSEPELPSSPPEAD
ncbi:acidic fibroblast growth factor binding protein [Polychytrium aggregatum]|uniref:acidic fibroblast growth factor binding protein n=1 Tax=Polychytrium aggregatum TaxID=110093 RepID=UPI0022FE3927|nr:acidic fibroblast growth factor binding protein [Polychytrium aggregatum]KAI9197482.1 acidic fibroblast growth factor binding protein [Polychytrium aggregatum]